MKCTAKGHPAVLSFMSLLSIEVEVLAMHGRHKSDNKRIKVMQEAKLTLWIYYVHTYSLGSLSRHDEYLKYVMIKRFISILDWVTRVTYVCHQGERTADCPLMEIIKIYVYNYTLCLRIVINNLTKLHSVLCLPVFVNCMYINCLDIRIEFRKVLVVKSSC